MQVAGQKSQAFAGFDGGTGQDNSVHLLCPEGCNSRRNGKIGLACAGRTDAERDCVICNGIAIGLLTQGFCLDGLSLCGYAHDIACKLVYLRLFALGNELQNVPHILSVDALATHGECQKAVYRLFGKHDILGLAADVYLIFTVDDLDGKLAFDDPEVLIKRAEHAYDMLHSFNFYRSFDHILLLYSQCTPP